MPAAACPLLYGFPGRNDHVRLSACTLRPRLPPTVASDRSLPESSPGFLPTLAPKDSIPLCKNK